MNTLGFKTRLLQTGKLRGFCIIWTFGKIFMGTTNFIVK